MATTIPSAALVPVAPVFTGQIVFEDDGYFLGHVNLLDVNGARTVPWPVASAYEKRRRSGMGLGKLNHPG